MESLYCLAPFRAFTPVMKEKACLAQALSSPHEVLILTSVMSSVSGSTKYEAIFPCERKSFLMTSPSLPPVSAGGRESAPRGARVAADCAEDRGPARRPVSYPLEPAAF